MDAVKIIIHPRKIPKEPPMTYTRISPEAGDVLRQIMRRTGLSASNIASQIILQAANFIECEIEE